MHAFDRHRSGSNSKIVNFPARPRQSRPLGCAARAKRLCCYPRRYPHRISPHENQLNLLICWWAQ